MKRIPFGILTVGPMFASNHEFAVRQFHSARAKMAVPGHFRPLNLLKNL
jgi:hypothetical protein